MFLTKKFKEKNQCYVFEAMIRNIKIDNILNIIKISKSKCILKMSENVYLNVSYDFSKFDGFIKIKV
jgi:hypothetical protein